MPIWLINIIVTLVVKYGAVEEQGDAIGYHWGNWTVIDNWDPSYFHLCWKDKTIYFI